MKALRLLIGALLVGAAACSDTGRSPVLPAGPSYGGGHTPGSSGGLPVGGGETTTTASDSSTTARGGGHTLGSGG